MQKDHAQQTSGEGFAEDALPLPDLAASNQRPFVVNQGVVMLKGSTSPSSGSKTFPERQVCQDTGARDMEPIIFGPYGKLYSFSIVHVSATRATPYTIGYVDFENGLRVLAEVRTETPDELNCDLDVELQADGDQWFVSPIQANKEGQQ